MSTTKTDSKSEDLLEQVSADKVLHNGRVLAFCRIFASIVGGIVTGAFGLTGLEGIGMFFAFTFISSFVLFLKADMNPAPYFKSSMDVWTGNLLGGMMSFILFWTLLYNMIHIY
eukprot:GILJ01003838.1.p1 GENE.GILJ01003838.1~~GILJ01003838.1.p1  ORF type:complete len:114 (-),score=16.12 GILJ01003838.1:193-534(-)